MTIKARVFCPVLPVEDSQGRQGLVQYLLLVLFLIIGLYQHEESAMGSVWQYRWSRDTHVVARLLALVASLVGLGFGLIRLALLSTECLPALTKNLADLA